MASQILGEGGLLFTQKTKGFIFLKVKHAASIFELINFITSNKNLTTIRNSKVNVKVKSFTRHVVNLPFFNRDLIIKILFYYVNFFLITLHYFINCQCKFISFESFNNRFQIVFFGMFLIEIPSTCIFHLRFIKQTISGPLARKIK